MFITTFIIVATIIYIFYARRLFYTWGATDAEVKSKLPGDEIIAKAQGQSTRAITIHAPAASIWQWLIQIGQGRGGFFSYDWLENLFGLDIHTLDHIVPDLQHLDVGDQIKFGKNGPIYKVALVEPDEALVLRVPDQKTLEYADPKSANYYDATWGFFLHPVDKQTTRLIIRGRGAAKTWGGKFANIIASHVSCIMEDRMMRRVKKLAEKSTRAKTA
ncbi:MAG: hypothetical protein KC708_02570 [Anaerolineae bacterium]|nr:hypothetical protein [Anaerolineae bacterium]